MWSLNILLFNRHNRRISIAFRRFSISLVRFAGLGLEEPHESQFFSLEEIQYTFCDISGCVGLLELQRSRGSFSREKYERGRSVSGDESAHTRWGEVRASLSCSRRKDQS